MSSPAMLEHLVDVLRQAGVHIRDDDAEALGEVTQSLRPPSINDVDAHDELTPEQASRLAVTAVTADLEYWARTAAVDGRVGLNDLIRTLDLIQGHSVPEL